MTDEERETVQQGGISRRDVMKRGAVVGGAMVWATPVVQSMANPAFAQTGTPKDISYVALCYTCDGGDTTCCVKFELEDDGTVGPCEQGSTFKTPGCEFANEADDCDGDNCDLFDVTVSDDGSTVTVCFTDDADTDCRILEAHAVGKCGKDGCVDGDIDEIDQHCATFTGCS